MRCAGRSITKKKGGNDEEDQRSIGPGGPGCGAALLWLLRRRHRRHRQGASPDTCRQAQHRLHPRRRHAQGRHDVHAKDALTTSGAGHGLSQRLRVQRHLLPFSGYHNARPILSQHGVWSNSSTDSPSTTIGGWRAYQGNSNEADNVATRLQSAGYRTGLFGKYLNGYNTTEVPPGWDRWFAHVNGIDYYDYQINDDGTIKHYESTSADYETDVIANQAKTFIGTSANAGVPFFAYVAPKAPHLPATPAPGDLHTYDGLKTRRPPSFNEKDVTDNLSWIRQLPRLSDAKKAKIENQHERRAESLQAVNDLVAGVVGTLKDKGVLSSTYIFFTSDNGWHEGEHRIQQGKWRPYEEDIHMPLVVRGPGVAAGSTTYKLVLNTDYLPTFTDLAGEQSPPYVDGRSLRPVLDGSVTSWRSAILLEAAANYSQPYRGIRTVTTNAITRRKYVEYAGGARELYNLESDGHELTNSYDAAAPPTSLAVRLQALKVCATYTCRAAEDGP